MVTMTMMMVVVVVLVATTDPGFEVVQLVSDVCQLSLQAFAFFLRVDRLHVLFCGARSKLLDLRAPIRSHHNNYNITVMPLHHGNYDMMLCVSPLYGSVRLKTMLI